MTHRIDDIYRPAEQRRRDFREVERPLSCAELHEQAARCMGCGIPFCHGAGRGRSSPRPAVSLSSPAASARRSAKAPVPTASTMSR